MNARRILKLSRSTFYFDPERNSNAGMVRECHLVRTGSSEVIIAVILVVDVLFLARTLRRGRGHRVTGNRVEDVMEREDGRSRSDGEGALEVLVMIESRLTGSEAVR